MRHLKKASPSFGRRGGPRKALIRGLVYSLVEHERIKITLARAKCVKPLVERAITIGKKGDVHSFRLLQSVYPNKKTVQKIVKELSPRFKERPGGYTRIIKLGFRQGDKAPLAYLEFVDYMPKLKTSVSSVEKSSEKKEDTKKILTAEEKKVQKLLKRKIDQKRKRVRLQQKKSRRINRPH